jgi:hypothetical protein
MYEYHITLDDEERATDLVAYLVKQSVPFHAEPRPFGEILIETRPEYAARIEDYLTNQDPAASLLIWRDGAKAGETTPDATPVQATVKPDPYGVTVSVRRAGAEHHSGEVLVEFYDKRLMAHVWNEEDVGGDPTASVELFTP